MHDLTCGHHVQSNVGEQCGSNCTHALGPAGTPFICRVCLAQRILEGLGLAPESSMDKSWDPTPYWAELATPIVGSLVEDEMRPLLGSGCRDATPIPMLDGHPEFVREYGSKVLVISQREVQVLESMFYGMEIGAKKEKMAAVEEMFRGMEIGANEEKMAAMKAVFAALELREMGRKQ